MKRTSLHIRAKVCLDPQAHDSTRSLIEAAQYYLTSGGAFSLSDSTTLSADSYGFFYSPSASFNADNWDLYDENVRKTVFQTAGSVMEEEDPIILTVPIQENGNPRKDLSPFDVSHSPTRSEVERKWEKFLVANLVELWVDELRFSLSDRQLQMLCKIVESEQQRFKPSNQSENKDDNADFSAGEKLNNQREEKYGQSQSEKVHLNEQETVENTTGSSAVENSKETGWLSWIFGSIDDSADADISSHPATIPADLSWDLRPLDVATIVAISCRNLSLTLLESRVTWKPHHEQRSSTSPTSPTSFGHVDAVITRQTSIPVSPRYN